MHVQMGTVDSKIETLGDRLHAKFDTVDKKIEVLGARLSAKDESLESKIDAVGLRLDQKIDARFDALRTELTSMRNWALGLYIALAAGMFATFARGFGWI